MVHCGCLIICLYACLTVYEVAAPAARLYGCQVWIKLLRTVVHECRAQEETQKRLMHRMRFESCSCCFFMDPTIAAIHARPCVASRRQVLLSLRGFSP